LVIGETTPKTGAKWVKRNEDKPHRCPQCHAIALRAWARSADGGGYGPRTVFHCCGLRWRVGRRAKRYPMAFRQRLAEADRQMFA
jgi:hypothetical protein